MLFGSLGLQAPRRRWWVVFLLMLMGALAAAPSIAHDPPAPEANAADPAADARAQKAPAATTAAPSDRDTKGAEEADRRFEAAMKPPAEQAAAAQPNPNAPHEDPDSLNLLQLAKGGGFFMIPIMLFSFVVVLYGLERLFALRRRRVIPRGLIEGLKELAANRAGFDPRKAYRLVQQYPSAAATVVRAMLMKIGRPNSEVEQAVALTSDREAAKLYANVRPINLAVATGPFLGLIGTVQGMILAFHDTAYLPVGANRAAFLARGVYSALVCTFAGLCVAIVGACISHYFEGKIQRLFRDIDELIAKILPELERYEGKLRVGRPQLGGPPETERPDGKPTEPAPLPAAAPE